MLIRGGVYPSIITNGTALNNNNADKLLKSGLSKIQISFQSLNKKVYESTMVGADYDKTLKQVLSFIHKARKQNVNIYISISTVKTKESIPYMQESREFWKKMPIDNYYEGEVLTLQTESKLYDEAMEGTNSEEYKVCVNPWNSAKVNVDGTVNLCGHDFSNRYPIGNIKDAPFYDIINGAKAQRFRKAVLEADFDFLNNTVGYKCQYCNVWTSRVGCNVCEYTKKVMPITMAINLEEIVSIDRKYDTDYLDNILSDLGIIL